MTGKWTIETLKEHYDGLREADRKAVETALASQEKLNKTVHESSQEAIKKAEDAQKQYNQGHNDLSRKMELQYKEMIPRSEAAARDKNLQDKIDAQNLIISSLSSRLDTMSGKGAGINQFIGWIVAAIVVAAFFIKNKNG